MRRRPIRRPKIRKNGGAKYCSNNHSRQECHEYLLSVTNHHPAVGQLFNILNSNIKYNGVKNGQLDVEGLMDGDELMGIFCGGSECGNFYGVGSCGGVCCGVGGLGIGCHVRIKDKRDSHY
jgi:hypothetical protein